MQTTPRRYLAPLISCLAAVLYSTVAMAQTTPAAPAPSKPAVPNALAAAASNIGVKRCLSALTRLSTFGLQGTRNHDILLDWDRKSPDSGIMFSLIGMEYTNGSAAMSIITNPESDGGCSIAAERISIAPYTCESVARQELAGYRVTQLLGSFHVYTDPKDTHSSVSLIDSPPGCLVIRRYIEFSWKDPAASPPTK